MKKQKKVKSLLLVVCVVYYLLSAMDCFAQTVQSERIFNASGLYGFMNGGTDQFLEYDVQQLTVRDVTYKGEAYTVEIYEMATPEDAFGIYSLHTFRCMRADTLGCLDCLSAYQLQAVSGNKYVSVVFPSGSRVAMESADELLCMYVPMDGRDSPVIPELLQLTSPYSGNLKYLRGPLSVSTASFTLAGIVENIPYKSIWFVAGKPSTDYHALIYVNDPESIRKIKEIVQSTHILATGADYIYIKGTEEELEEDFGVFGF